MIHVRLLSRESHGVYRSSFVHCTDDKCCILENVAHILGVDDEDIVLDLIATVLRSDGHTVTALSDPSLASDYFNIAAIDLILTDVTMTPFSGFELVKRLTIFGFDGKVLFMSGFSNLSASISRSIGEWAVLEKPFTAMELRKAVKRILSGTKAKAPQPAIVT
jgi:DNA-binding NtrC family response regulator